MRAADFRSISCPYPDRDSHAIRHATYNFPLTPSLKMKNKSIHILILSLLFSCSNFKSTDEKSTRFKNKNLKTSIYKEVIDSLGSGFTIIENEDSVQADSIYIIFDSGFDKDSIELYYDSILIFNERLFTDYSLGLSGVTLLPRSKKDTTQLDLIINDSLYYKIKEPNIYNYIHFAVIYDTLVTIYTNKRYTYE